MVNVIVLRNFMGKNPKWKMLYHVDQWRRTLCCGQALARPYSENIGLGRLILTICMYSNNVKSTQTKFWGRLSYISPNYIFRTKNCLLKPV